MGAIVAVDALAIDTILPALSFIGDAFDIQHDNDRQFVVTAIFAGYALGVLVYGIASDSFGRKPPIYIGFVIFLIGTVITIFASSFSMLLAGRALQGVGAAGPQIIPTAITRDIYKGRGMAEIMSLIMMIFMIVPALAPIIGQGILMISNWQGVFVGLGIYALLAFVWFAIRQPETLPKEKRVPFSLTQVWLSIKEVLRNAQAVKYTIAESMAFASILIYLSTAQQVFQDHYKLGDKFALYFGALALVMMLATFVNSRLVNQFGMRFLVTIAASVLCFVSMLYLLLIKLGGVSPPLWSFLFYASITYFCLGILFGNMHSLAMETVGHVAGVAASVIGSISTLIAITIAAIAGSFYNDSIIPIVLAFGILMIPIIGIAWSDRHNGLQAQTY